MWLGRILLAKALHSSKSALWTRLSLKVGKVICVGALQMEVKRFVGSGAKNKLESAFSRSRFDIWRLSGRYFVFIVASVRASMTSWKILSLLIHSLMMAKGSQFLRARREDMKAAFLIKLEMDGVGGRWRRRGAFESSG